jgi:hypothetical protein
MRTYVSERSAREILLIAILGTFIASPLLTLSYMTITVRYIADLWLPLGFMLPVFSYIWISGEYKHGFFTNRGSIFLIGILVLANLIYAHTVYSEYKGWNIRGTVNGQPNNEILERLKNPPTLSIDKDQACARYGFKTSGILKTSDH